MHNWLKKIEFITESGYYKYFKNKAFNIWYDLIKLHLLINGNKRVAFACFVLYCDSNNKKPQEKSKSDFMEISCLIATSAPEDKGKVIEELNKRISFIKNHR